MAVNKVVFGDQTLIDLTGDTVTEDLLMIGESAHDKTGKIVYGRATAQTFVINNGGTVSKISGTTDDYLLTF